MRRNLIIIAMCFFSLSAGAEGLNYNWEQSSQENASTATQIKVTGGANGQCSPDMIDLKVGNSYEIVLEAEQGMFLFEAPDFSLNLMAAPNASAKQVIVPTQKGNFNFKCGIHGSPQGQQTIGMIMVM